MLIAEWKQEDLERNRAILAVKVTPSGSEVQHSHLFLICLHWFSLGSPLYSHSSVIRGNTGRGLLHLLVPYIIPRAREGRFASEALGRSGSGEWVCCAWGVLIMGRFDLARGPGGQGSSYGGGEQSACPVSHRDLSNMYLLVTAGTHSSKW